MAVTKRRRGRKRVWTRKPKGSCVTPAAKKPKYDENSTFPSCSGLTQISFTSSSILTTSGHQSVTLASSDERCGLPAAKQTSTTPPVCLPVLRKTTLKVPKIVTSSLKDRGSGVSEAQSVRAVNRVTTVTTLPITRRGQSSKSNSDPPGIDLFLRIQSVRS